VTWRAFAALATAWLAEAELAPAVTASLGAAACNRGWAFKTALLIAVHGLLCKLLGWCSTLLLATHLLLLMLLLALSQST
jgi:hypothetical protein